MEFGKKVLSVNPSETGDSQLDEMEVEVSLTMTFKASKHVKATRSMLESMGLVDGPSGAQLPIRDQTALDDFKEARSEAEDDLEYAFEVSPGLRRLIDAHPENQIWDSSLSNEASNEELGRIEEFYDQYICAEWTAEIS